MHDRYGLGCGRSIFALLVVLVYHQGSHPPSASLHMVPSDPLKVPLDSRQPQWPTAVPRGRVVTGVASNDARTLLPGTEPSLPPHSLSCRAQIAGEGQLRKWTPTRSRGSKTYTAVLPTGLHNSWRIPVRIPMKRKPTLDGCRRRVDWPGHLSNVFFSQVDDSLVAKALQPLPMRACRIRGPWTGQSWHPITPTSLMRRLFKRATNVTPLMSSGLYWAFTDGLQ